MIRYIAFMLLLIPSLAFASPAMDAVIALHVTPSWILFGLCLILLEAFLPTKGLLGLIGTIVFVLGTFSLADYTDPNLRLSWNGIILLDVLVVGAFLLSAFLTVRGYNRKHDDVTDPMLNQTGTVTEWNDEMRRVRIGDTLWLACSAHNENFSPGDKIVVQGQDNLTLVIASHRKTLP